MDKRKIFIDIIQDVVFNDPDWDSAGYTDEEWNAALAFFEELKKKSSESKPMTETGQKIYQWMQEHQTEMSNMFTSKEIAEALFMSGRSVAGSMRKLVNDGLVIKTGTNPIQYSLNPMIVETSIDN